jgi:hypothetical protein
MLGFPRHPDCQRTNLPQDCRPTYVPSHGRPLACDQLLVPVEDRVRSDERRDVDQRSSSEAMARRRESTSLGIGEVQALAAQVLSEDTVLFP